VNAADGAGKDARELAGRLAEYLTAKTVLVQPERFAH
jgi:hypothetical protein